MARKRDIVYVGKETDTPVGPVWVAISEQGLVAVELGDEPEELIEQLPKLGFRQVVSDPAKTKRALQQIRDYLLGKHKEFTIPIDWSVLTPFQEKALKATCILEVGCGTGHWLAAMAQAGRRQELQPGPEI